MIISNNSLHIIWNDATKHYISEFFSNDTIITNSTQLSSKLETLKECSAIITLCELQWTHDGNSSNLQQLSGIELTKELRRKGVTAPIVFTSFLSHKQVYNNKLERSIINAIGSTFVQLPCAPDDWKRAAEKMKPLEKLEMYDVVNNYCLSSGNIRMALHALHGYTGADIRGAIIDVLRQIHEMFGKNAAFCLAEFNRLFQKVTPDNKKSALDFADATGERLIEEFIPSEAIGSTLRTDGNWTILLLDDEIDSNHELVKGLLIRGVKEVICTRTAEEAEMALEKDYNEEKRIVLVVSDYRLENKQDGYSISQPKQGYRFIAEQIKQMPHLRYAALSALPRRFLIKSFNHFGIRADVFSKKDYLSNTATLNLLCNELVELGNENAKAITRLPGITSKGWADFVPFYFHHRNSSNYKENENKISTRAKEYCEGIKEGKYPFTLEHYTNKLAGKKKTPENKKSFDEFLDKMLCRRVAIWYSQYHSAAKLEDVHRVIRGNSYTGNDSESKIKQHVNINLGLSLDDFPFNMTIEEKYWMTYEMDFGNLDELEKQDTDVIQFITDELETWIDQNSLRNTISIHPNLMRFFNNEKPQYGVNIKSLKTFLYKLQLFVLNDNHNIQSLQKTIISWGKKLKDFPESKRTSQLIQYIERLRVRLLYSKPIASNEKIIINDQEVIVNKILEQVINFGLNIPRDEYPEFNQNTRIFINESASNNRMFANFNVLIKELTDFHELWMSELKKEGIEYDEAKPTKKNQKRNRNEEDDESNDNNDTTYDF